MIRETPSSVSRSGGPTNAFDPIPPRSTGPELPSECDDGIDNDGDGYADWQRDLGCYGPGDHTECATIYNHNMYVN